LASVSVKDSCKKEETYRLKTIKLASQRVKDKYKKDNLSPEDHQAYIYPKTDHL